MTDDVDVVIVGGGLAGLCAARESTHAGLSTVLLEADDGVGGRVRTDLVDGYRLDRGFQILLLAYPEVQAALDIDALSLCRFDPASRIWTGDHFDRVADPLRQPSALFDTLRADVGSVADKTRIGRLRQRLVRTPAVRLMQGADRSVADALDGEGFSTEMIERFFRPLMGGITLDPELTGSARMYELIFRTLAVGDAAVPAHGMQAISSQLASDLPAGVVRLDSRVERIDATTVTVADGSTVRGRAVVVATEGPVAADLVGTADPGSKCVSALWFSADDPPMTGRSIMLDGTRSGPAVNFAVMSEVAPSYAPSGKSLMVAACPGQIGPDLEADVRSQLRGWFGGSVSDWDLLRVDRIPHGQPLSPPSFPVKQRVSLGDGRFVTGDHRDTPSIQGAMFSGRRCGDAVVRSLAS